MVNLMNNNISTVDGNSVTSISEHTASDGKNYKTKFYNLNAIFSVDAVCLICWERVESL